IDLILATPGPASDLAKCPIWEHEHGSNHRAIRTNFWIDTDTQANVDEMAGCLSKLVNTVSEAHCPRAKPSPCTNRWWNESLTALRKSYTYWRNRASAMLQGGDDIELRNKQRGREGSSTGRFDDTGSSTGMSSLATATIC
ncbi:hypothetical protein K469DRAFT_761238, partial [Zopfia rhizophila CBS 207.26]